MSRPVLNNGSCFYHVTDFDFINVAIKWHRKKNYFFESLSSVRFFSKQRFPLFKIISDVMGFQKSKVSYAKVQKSNLVTEKHN